MGQSSRPARGRDLYYQTHISRHHQQTRQHSDGAHTRRRTQIRSDIRESGTGACGTVSAHTMAHHSSECRVWQPLARNCIVIAILGRGFLKFKSCVKRTSMDALGWRRAGQLVAASVRAFLGPAHHALGPLRCVFNNPIIPTLTSSSTSSPDEAGRFSRPEMFWRRPAGLPGC